MAESEESECTLELDFFNESFERKSTDTSLACGSRELDDNRPSEVWQPRLKRDIMAEILSREAVGNFYISSIEDWARKNRLSVHAVVNKLEEIKEELVSEIKLEFVNIGRRMRIRFSEE